MPIKAMLMGIAAFAILLTRCSNDEGRPILGSIPSGKVSPKHIVSHCFHPRSGTESGSSTVSHWFQASIPSTHLMMGRLRTIQDAARPDPVLFSGVLTLPDGSES